VALSSRRLVVFLAAIAVANALIFGIERFLIAPFVVPSNSMAPFVQLGDRILVDRHVDAGKLDRGDVIVFRAYAEEDGKVVFDATGNGVGKDDVLVKRVIGLPGERIQGGDQIIAIDRYNRIDEPWARWDDDDSDFGPEELKDDELWVMGDSREDSRDSRAFGPVPTSVVFGTVKARFWPWDRREMFEE
jgi:signal peptidase I